MRRQFQDELDEEIFSSIRNEEISAQEKMLALIRAGQIASVYTGAQETLLDSVFGITDALQHDLRAHHAAR
jgi:hypothetical protein